MAPTSGIAVLSSDFKSTVVSIVDPAGPTLGHDDCLDSGSVTPVLSAALSGNVAFPSRPQPNGALVLIDETNSALVWLDPKGCRALSQLSVATGFSSNPHDLVGISPTKAYVPRYEHNPTPSGQAGAFDQGDDLLVIDPSAQTVTGRVDLSSLAEAGVLARPDRALLIGGKLYVGLDEVANDLKTVGAARIAIVDPASDTVSGSIDIAGYKDCTGLDSPPGSQLLVLACLGDYNDAAHQVAQSGVLVYDLSGAMPKLIKTVPASMTGGRALGTALAALSDKWAYVSTYGDFSGTPPDQLWAIDLGAGTAQKVVDGDGVFAFGAVIVDATRKRLLVSDGGMTNPRVLVYDVSQPGQPQALPSFTSNPKSGLPPRLLGWY
jgi:hypothetical protein